MFCCTLLYVHSRIAIILLGKRELFALLNLSSWCLEVVERLFLAVPWGRLQFVIVVFQNLLLLSFFFTISTGEQYGLSEGSTISKPIISLISFFMVSIVLKGRGYCLSLTGVSTLYRVLST